MKLKFTPATGIDGRLRRPTDSNPTNQVGTAFSESERHNAMDTADSSTVFPVGASQSKAAAYKLHYRTKFRDLNISIENRAGSYRYWTDQNGKEGKTLQRYPYGYIRLTEGMDGDHIDCYLGDNKDAPNVYIITTNAPPDFKKQDEQKCMLGFDSAEEAKSVFLKHYDDPRFFRALKSMSYEDFKNKALSTPKSTVKKIASNLQLEQLKDNRPSPTFEGQVPGDFLGLPRAMPAMRKIVGDDLSPTDKIDKSFRFMDQDMNTRVLEGTGGLPESPGV